MVATSIGGHLKRMWCSDPALTKISLNNNDMTSLSKESLAFQVTLWGKSLIVDDDFTLILENKLHGKKLKSIWIRLYKKNITDKDIKIRSVTVRKIHGLPPQPAWHIKKISELKEKLSTLSSYFDSTLRSIKGKLNEYKK